MNNQKDTELMLGPFGLVRLSKESNVWSIVGISHIKDPPATEHKEWYDDAKYHAPDGPAIDNNPPPSIIMSFWGRRKKVYKSQLKQG